MRNGGNTKKIHNLTPECKITGYCLLKFCDASLYSKLKNGEFIFPNEREFIEPRINALLNRKTDREGKICILCGDLGSAKSLGLLQIKKFLEKKINDKVISKKSKIAYIDMLKNSIPIKIWETYKKEPKLYEPNKSNPSIKIIDSFILDELKKQKPLKVFKKGRTISEIIKAIKSGEIINQETKQFIFIDNLDSLLGKIYENEFEKYEREGNLQELIRGLKILKIHIVRAYKDITGLHKELGEIFINGAGGCLVTVRKETNLAKPTKFGTISVSVELDKYGIDIDDWWDSHEDYLTAILIYYLAQYKEKKVSCDQNCEICNYKLDSKLYQFCQQLKDGKFASETFRDDRFVEIKKRLKRNLDLSDKNVRKFLFPFAHIQEDSCVQKTENGKNLYSINNGIRTYYRGGRDPVGSANRAESLIRTYLDLFPIYYEGNLKKTYLERIDELGNRKPGEIEAFLIKNIMLECTKKEWVKKIKTSLKGSDSDSIFHYLELSGILRKLENDTESKYKVAEFTKFVYNKDLTTDNYLFIK